MRKRSNLDGAIDRLVADLTTIAETAIRQGVEAAIAQATPRTRPARASRDKSLSYTERTLLKLERAAERKKKRDERAQARGAEAMERAELRRQEREQRKAERLKERQAAQRARTEERERLRSERMARQAAALLPPPPVVVKRARDGQITVLERRPPAQESLGQGAQP